jgi:hypothetical protein
MPYEGGSTCLGKSHRTPHEFKARRGAVVSQLRQVLADVPSELGIAIGSLQAA